MWQIITKVQKNVPKIWLIPVIESFEKKYRTQNQEVAVILVSGAFIRNLNRTYRGKDYSANVLSFPGAGDSLGDIFLCPTVIKKEAKTHDRTLKKHFQFLLAHGLLHLVGFDHQKDADYNKMSLAEKSLLKGL